MYGNLKLKITSQHKQFFNSQGYVVLENVLPLSLTEKLSSLCDLTNSDLKQYSSDKLLDRDSFNFNFKYKIAKRIASQHGIQLASKKEWNFRSIFKGAGFDTHPKVRQYLTNLDSDINLHTALKFLMDSSTVKFCNSHIWKKYARSCDPTEVHRDYTGLNIASGSKGVIVWMSPENVSINESALQVIPGSHLEMTDDKTHTVDIDYFNRDKYNLVNLEIKACDLIILDLRTQHCATPNISNEDRCAAAIRYYGDDMVFF